MPTDKGDPTTVLAQRDDTTCRVRDVLDRVGSKWALSVISELGQGSRRFTQIKRAVPGISQRMLTDTLRGLERDGLIERTVYPVVPPRVDYELTPLGHTLLATVQTLLTWALDHVDDIDEARHAYDTRAEETLDALEDHKQRQIGHRGGDEQFA